MNINADLIQFFLNIHKFLGHRKVSFKGSEPFPPSQPHNIISLFTGCTADSMHPMLVGLDCFNIPLR